MPTESLRSISLRGSMGPSSAIQHGEILPFSVLNFGLDDVQDRCDGVKAPLTLFAPYPHEDDPQEDHVELDRPVTPINEEIKAAPTTFKKLSKLVRRRISLRSNVKHLANEDQQALAAVIMGEVNGIWPEIRAQLKDPFLNEEENFELQRRVIVHIVTVCQRLFDHYINKAEILNKRGIFSGPANMSRLKAQLALDANKYLNVLTIRRYLVEDLRGKESDASPRSGMEEKCGKSSKAPLALSHKVLIEASRPLSRSAKQHYPSPSEDIEDLATQMPGLDTNKLVPILAQLPHTKSRVSDDTFSSSQVSKLEVPSRKTSEVLSKEKILLKRCESDPCMGRGENLLEELGMVDEDGRLSACSVATCIPSLRPTPQDEKTKQDKPSKVSAADDLKQLIARSNEKESKGFQHESEEDMPPLIQALTRSSCHDGQGEVLKKRLRELEEREKIQREKEKIILKEASHPQPATVAARFPNKVVVRTSDVRVSERVCLSSLTLNKHATVYNDLIDEIDPATVKALDSNLFLGDEMTEVYSQIMETVPTDHLELEEDSQVEPSADFVDLSTVLASSTLGNHSSQRVLNLDLKHREYAPWGENPRTEWARTPVNPPKDFRGNNLVNPRTPRGAANRKETRRDAGSQLEHTGNKGSLAGNNEPVNEHLARSYATWLTWWKNTLNTEDYLKYLSTQETDYMAALFHFYDSDDSDDEDFPSKQNGDNQPGSIEEEKEKQLGELRSQKCEFKEGFWNANSILMGGLGNDPQLPEPAKDEALKTPSEDTNNLLKPPLSRTRVVSRMSLLRMTESATPSDRRDRIGEEERATTALSKSNISRAETKLSTSSQKTVQKMSNEQVKKSNVLSPQDRLERVWAALQFPDNLKLDMAIKYSSDLYHWRIEKAIDAWEKATHLILSREALVAKLEDFERLASDPNRFFERGERGSSLARMDESKVRNSIYKQIDAVDFDLRSLLEKMDHKFADTVSFQGRPYMEKMKWDRTEMLYWLQEERKQQAISHETRLRASGNMSLRTIQLTPITPQV